jgi:hypothetical protein
VTGSAKISNRLVSKVKVLDPLDRCLEDELHPLLTIDELALVWRR